MTITQLNNKLRKRFNFDKIKKSLPVLIVVGKYLLHFLAAFMLSMTPVIGRYFPFSPAAAVAFGSDPLTAVIVLTGSLSGVILSGSSYLFKYIAACILVFLCKSFWRLFTDKPVPYVFVAVFSGASMLVCSFLFTASEGFLLFDLMFTLIESVIAAITAYCYSIVYYDMLIGKKKVKVVKDAHMKVAFIVSVSTLFLGASSFNIFGVAPGRIAVIVLVMIAAKIGGMPFGALAGAVSGFAMSLWGGNISHIIGVYTMGGLCAGAFNKVNKFWMSFVFMAANTIVTLYLNWSAAAFIGFAEIIAASIIFILLPDKALSVFYKVFNPSGKSNVSIDAGKTFGAGFDSFFSAFGELGDIFTTISERIESGKSQKDSVLTATNQICSSCGEYRKCYDESLTETKRSISVLQRLMNRKGRLEAADMPSAFDLMCVNKNKIIKDANNYENEFFNEKKELSSLRETRKIVYEQYSLLSRSMLEASRAMISNKTVEISLGEKIALEFSDKYKADRCTVLRNGDGVYSVVFYSSVTLNAAALSEICETASSVISRPLIHSSVEFDNGTVFKLIERPYFKAESAFLCLSKDALQGIESSKYCGDSADCFENDGKLFSILSDGMGSGRIAALDSATAVGAMRHLLSSGVNAVNASSLVNMLMLVKWDDETFSTLDSLIVDLYSGKADFVKSGAADSFIVSGELMHKIGCDVPPVGILSDIKHEVSSLMLKDDDMIFMMSDGAYDCLSCIANFNEVLAEAAKLTVSLAVDMLIGLIKEQKCDRWDDVSVMCVSIHAQ